MRRIEERVPGGTALLISAILVSAFAVWQPPLRDLAAHTFRAEYFEQHGYALWNNSWYGGHYMLTYSILFPPLSALLTPEWAGALSAIAAAYLFDRLVITRWGEQARWGSYWFASFGAVAMLANGWLAFALGVAFALAALRALQAEHGVLAAVTALACALSSPVAAIFLALVVTVGWLAEEERKNGAAALAVVLCAIVPLVALNLAFPEAGRFPFWFSAWWPLPLLCITALIAVKGIPGERQFRWVVGVYLAIGTLIWLTSNQIGGNFTRMGSLFGGPVLAAIVLSKRPQVPKVLVALALTVAFAWQVITPLPDTIQSLGDPSTERSYYKPLNEWLDAHGGRNSRTEIPFTFNHWETAYVTPRFPIARGWLRQLDTERNDVFYEGRLTDARYLAWLKEKGVRYVAASDAQLDYSSQIEDDLVRRRPSYLKLRAELPHWKVYEVRSKRLSWDRSTNPGSAPTTWCAPRHWSDGRLRPKAGRRLAFVPDAELVNLGPESFTLKANRPGSYTVKVWHSPYWSVESGQACVGRNGDWTLVRATRPGPIRVGMSFSLKRALDAARGRAACRS